MKKLLLLFAVLVGQNSFSDGSINPYQRPLERGCYDFLQQIKKLFAFMKNNDNQDSIRDDLEKVGSFEMLLSEYIKKHGDAGENLLRDAILFRFSDILAECDKELDWFREEIVELKQ